MRIFLLSLIALLFAGLTNPKPSFEGKFSVEFKNEKGELTKSEIKVKGQDVFIKTPVDLGSRYHHYIINLSTRELYAITGPEKKIVLKFDLDSLTAFYERYELKPGYKRYPELLFKSADKTKEENGITLTKYIAENDIHKSSCWTAAGDFDFDRIIPFLRLIECWNEVQGIKGIIYHADLMNKVSRRESSINVLMTRESIQKETFLIPAGYLKKDLQSLVDKNRDNKDLKTIIKTFAGF